MRIGFPYRVRVFLVLTSLRGVNKTLSGRPLVNQ